MLLLNSCNAMNTDVETKCSDTQSISSTRRVNRRQRIKHQRIKQLISSAMAVFHCQSAR